jgi:hypothetical protein
LLGRSSAVPSTSAMAAAQSGEVAEFPLSGPEVVGVTGAGIDREADRAVSALYAERYRSLVRLAALLVDDMATAEEVVQDSFIAIHANWRRLQDIDKAAGYLRQCVVNRSHSVLRHRGVVNRNMHQPLPDMPSAEEDFLRDNARRWCCGITLGCRRLRSPRPWELPGAPSSTMSHGPCRRCGLRWRGKYEPARS